ncbi:hypothetical protein [Gardnerella sp. KA00127]|uniref:hypothetical protein n=1 Tax=Gardnerella sp. KA00127 TaxID=2749070 RepID=UPI003BAA2A7B
MSGFDNWNPNYVPYTPPAQGGGRKANGSGKNFDAAKRRSARKALIAQNKAERAARKAERQRRAAERKAAAIVRRQQAAIRRAERKRISEQKRLERLQNAQIRKQRVEEQREARQQKHQLVLEHKIEREKAHRLEQERRAACKALSELRKKTMGGGDTQSRVSIVDVNNDLPYVEDVAATRLWGVPDGLGGMLPLDGEVIFDDISDANLLFKKGKECLDKLSKPQLTYEADVVSLGKIGFSSDAVGVGDTVQIVDATFTPPIRVEGRVLKIEEDLLDSVDATRITLGNIHESYTQKRRAQEQKLDALIAQSDEWNAVADGNSLYVRDLIGRLNEVLNARGGYTYFTPDEGIFVYDKSEDAHPTTVTHIGGGFWRIADSLKPNGDWDWKNVCDGHGLFADRIYTGILSDAVGRNFWNLDTGEFSLQASVKIGGKTVQEIVDDSSAGVISKMNESLTQEAIFNKLTNGGQTQGIYLSGGQVYLNASYLKTGSLNAGLIKAGCIQDYVNSNWWDLTTSTIHISRGEIGGMTIANNKIHNRTLSLDEYGMHFMSGNTKYGRIGIIDYADSRHKVLFFGSRSDDCLIGFGIQSNGVGAYGAALTYSPTSLGTLEQGLNFSADCNFGYHKVSRAGLASDCVYEDGANMDSRTFYLPTSMNKDGTAREWVPVTFGFRHGFVI